MSDDVNLTRDELRKIISEGVQDAFKQMGVDADEPIQMQRDFAHLRRWRTAVDQAQSHSIKTTVGVLILGALGALWLGIKTLMNQP